MKFEDWFKKATPDIYANGGDPDYLKDLFYDAYLAGVGRGVADMVKLNTEDKKKQTWGGVGLPMSRREWDELTRRHNQLCSEVCQYWKEVAEKA